MSSESDIFAVEIGAVYAAADKRSAVLGRHISSLRMIGMILISGCAYILANHIDKVGNFFSTWCMHGDRAGGIELAIEGGNGSDDAFGYRCRSIDLAGDSPRNDRGMIAVAADHFLRHPGHVSDVLVGVADFLIVRKLFQDHKAKTVGGVHRGFIMRIV